MDLIRAAFRWRYVSKHDYKGELEEPDRPSNRYIVVGVDQRSNSESEYNSEFEWFRARLEKLARLFKQGGEINFLSDEDL